MITVDTKKLLELDFQETFFCAGFYNDRVTTPVKTITPDGTKVGFEITGPTNIVKLFSDPFCRDQIGQTNRFPALRGDTVVVQWWR